MTVENGQTTFPTTSQDKALSQDKLKIILRIGLMIFFEFALPIALYYIIRIFIQDVWAFLISGIPPFIIAIYGLIKRRRVDIIGVLVLTSLIFGAIVSSLNDRPGIQNLRKFTSTSTLPIGILFILSLIPIKIRTFHMRPLVFYIFKDLTTGGSFGHSSSKVVDEHWDECWISYQYFRRGFTLMTVTWGFGLLSEIPIRVTILFNVMFKLPPEKALVMVNIIHYVWLAKFSLFTLVIAIWMQKQSNKLASTSDKPLE